MSLNSHLSVISNLLVKCNLWDDLSDLLAFFFFNIWENKDVPPKYFCQLWPVNEVEVVLYITYTS